MEIIKPITELPPKPYWVSQAELVPMGDFRVLKSNLRV